MIHSTVQPTLEEVYKKDGCKSYVSEDLVIRWIEVILAEFNVHHSIA